jgi:hypothetical protein
MAVASPSKHRTRELGSYLKKLLARRGGCGFQFILIFVAAIRRPTLHDVARNFYPTIYEPDARN